VFLAQLAVGVLGVLVISGDYRTGTIRSSVAAVPHWQPILVATATAFAGLIFVVSTAAHQRAADAVFD
jgi:ABC-2 type transport system permease protein